LSKPAKPTVKKKKILPSPNSTVSQKKKKWCSIGTDTPAVVDQPASTSITDDREESRDTAVCEEETAGCSPSLQSDQSSTTSQTAVHQLPDEEETDMKDFAIIERGDLMLGVTVEEKRLHLGSTVASPASTDSEEEQVGEMSMFSSLLARNVEALWSGPDVEACKLREFKKEESSKPLLQQMLLGKHY
jgi:hypothetical protein